jgi:hypothetical protein
MVNKALISAIYRELRAGFSSHGLVFLIQQAQKSCQELATVSTVQPWTFF